MGTSRRRSSPSGVGPGVAVGVGEAVGVAEGVGVGDAVGDGVAVGVSVGVAVGDGVGVGVSDGVSVGLGLAVGGTVAVGLGRGEMGVARGLDGLCGVGNGLSPSREPGSRAAGGDRPGAPQESMTTSKSKPAMAAQQAMSHLLIRGAGLGKRRSSLWHDGHVAAAGACESPIIRWAWNACKKACVCAAHHAATLT